MVATGADFMHDHGWLETHIQLSENSGNKQAVAEITKSVMLAAKKTKPG